MLESIIDKDTASFSGIYKTATDAYKAMDSAKALGEFISDVIPQAPQSSKAPAGASIICLQGRELYQYKKQEMPLDQALEAFKNTMKSAKLDEEKKQRKLYWMLDPEISDYPFSKEQTGRDIKEITKILSNDHPAAYERYQTSIELFYAYQKVLKNKKDIRVLDYGGYCGIDYASFKMSFPLTNVEYTIKEIPQVIKQSEAFWNTLPEHKISFVENFTDKDKDSDILYIGSTLQYIIDEDWEKKIKELTSLNAKCILISKTYFCSVLASHFTRQVNARSSENTYAMLYRVFNIDDIISLIESLGYQLLFNHKVPPRHKFDNMLELEIDYSLHDLLFVKKETIC